MQFLDCSTHGKKEWRGTVMCGRCKAPWLLPGEGQTVEAIDVVPPSFGKCSCGTQLVPRRPGDKHFSAVPICESCYQEQIAKAQA